tara:strand:- start:8894 stop:9244 length:351 start_codon:yes stop_codon:yes gene_type:complete
MAVSTLSTGVFAGLVTDSTGVHIPLASIQYGTSTLSQANASGDYRALLRGLTQTYWDFMSGTATGTGNPNDFNKPAYFSMTRTSPSVASSTTLSRSYSSKFTFELGDPLNMSFPSE